MGLEDIPEIQFGEIDQDKKVTVLKPERLVKEFKGREYSFGSFIVVNLQDHYFIFGLRDKKGSDRDNNSHPNCRWTFEDWAKKKYQVAPEVIQSIQVLGGGTVLFQASVNEIHFKGRSGTYGDYNQEVAEPIARRFVQTYFPDCKLVFRRDR